ncbi:MAG TPA: hypothetical protein VFW40_11935 [Capsulimonadaceae bacterium]|nr:hypothetical protein [Capsulimonadaceae bacterium]
MNFDERRNRPMGTADLFDEAFDLYKKNFTLFLGVAALVFVPLSVFASFYDYSWNQSFLDDLAGASASGNIARSFGLLLEWARNAALLLPIYFLATTFMTGALVAAVSARYLYQPITMIGAYRVALARGLSLLSSMALFDLLLLVCALVCIFPVFFPAVLLLFTPQAAVVEGKVGLLALGRARSLVAGHTGRILGSLLLLILLYLALEYAIEGPLSYFADKLVTSSLPLLPALATHQELAEQITDRLTSLVVLPFVATLTTVLYYDLRIRKEGYDMDVLAVSLGYPPVEMTTVRPFGAPPPALNLSPPAVRKSRK